MRYHRYTYVAIKKREINFQVCISLHYFRSIFFTLFNDRRINLTFLCDLLADMNAINILGYLCILSSIDSMCFRKAAYIYILSLLRV